MNPTNGKISDSQLAVAEALHAALVEYAIACEARPPELLAVIEFFERLHPDMRTSRGSALQSYGSVNAQGSAEEKEARREAAEQIRSVLIRYFAHYGDVPAELVRAVEFFERELDRD